MAPAPPPLPTRFPCWVRAVYSWGGESKRDLGFIEGDLIECLNAGDGSWWTGRLFRDRRAIGLFPSNFVEVLPDNFRPTTRSVSPLPSSNTPSPKGTPQKSRTFRKPFEAYAKAPHYTTAKTPETWKEGALQPRETAGGPSREGGIRSREPSENSINTTKVPPSTTLGRDPSSARASTFVSRDHSPGRAPSFVGRAPSPAAQHYISRDPSPAPAPSHIGPDLSPSRAPSFGSRAPSPAPSYIPYRPPQSRPHAYHLSLDRTDSYGPASHREDSPPPPPPPPHRSKLPRHGAHASYDEGYYGGLSREPSAISREHSNASYNYRPRQEPDASYEPPGSGYHTPRVPSPGPPSTGGLTPSPLREAMDDVMEQLDALGAGREVESPEPALDPWSPASFDVVHQRSRKQRDQQLRPQTSMGIPQQVDEGYETFSGSAESSQEPTHHGSYQEQQPFPQLSNYVERMESRLRTMHQQNSSMLDVAEAPQPPPKGGHIFERPKSSMDMHAPPDQKLQKKKSAYEISRQVLNRTFTTKTNSTNSSSATQSTDRSLMSGVSAGGISATSAGSLARKNRSRAQSALAMRDLDLDRPGTPFTGVTYHSSHASGEQRSKSQMGFHEDAMPALGGLVQPKPKKQNFIKRILESAKTGVASTRGSLATSSSSLAQPTPSGRLTPAHMSSSGPLFGKAGRDPGREMGPGGGVDWVQVRRDVNRSNSLSENELVERKERCQMLDYPALNPVDELYNSIDGDEGADGMPVAEPINYSAINLSQVDKNTRFLASLPPTTTPITLATTYVCRPYRSDVQRLRSIFTWVSEKICWEEDFDGPIDTRRVIQTKRACAEEYATLVLEMCAAVGLTCEIVRGYLKSPGEIPDVSIMPRSNHWWNAVLVDNEWRMMDCCLASPSNPRRIQYSSYSSSSADPWWFLTRPSEICWTHIPEHHAQQHMCPPVAHEILLNLPCACPPYFKNGLQMIDYNTSLTRIEDLEMVHIRFSVPPDVEVAAEVEVRAYSRDADGDCFESGDTVKKRALAQAEWSGGVKRYTVKALLPGDEGTGVLKVYAGKRGLMHSIKDIPHPLAFALPIIHTGENPPYEFVTRHPTPHAQRHDIYVVQPQCQRLALNNTFVFAIRQHPSSPVGASAAALTPSSNNPRTASPIPFARPASALSMTSSSAAGSNPSTTASAASGGGGNPSSSSSSSSNRKPAKLAIQTPGGKILRLMRKEERRGIGGVLGAGGGGGGGGRGPAGAALGEDEAAADGGVWETIIKCSERGVWRGLVLADRTARWCVFAEWVCEG
ncbi:354b3e14-567c-422a-86f5-ee6952e325ea [Thermothielavioides terrestris]|uniref:354b3e14-567c-422a-86f5-ee6952e325ea n=1 Tax=Thermothielavioides terrestris TaxID=2587410 RepID=A0A3S4AM21_9PEZI|nr:354b3e14-567c-422a-86f5-ee6952e325ea [Thermothielavioides terrestris]